MNRVYRRFSDALGTATELCAQTNLSAKRRSAWPDADLDLRAENTTSSADSRRNLAAAAG
jgi:hypothetical protein